MSTDMEVDSSESEIARIALHPLTIVHMSDQYTRVTCGGSPLPADAPVVGLLFGSIDNSTILQVHDADDIPPEISDATRVQVDLHKAVFPQHSVVGWYRVSGSDEEPQSLDLEITKTLRQHYAPSASSTFCFCLLQVSKNSNPAPDSQSTMHAELPISLYSLQLVDGLSFLLGLNNWQLETSEPERIAVERVMKEPAPDSPRTNTYIGQTRSMQQSMLSMKERIQFLVEFLEQTQQEGIPPNYCLLRQIQGLLYSLGPVSSSLKLDDSLKDAELFSHLAVVAKTINAVESYIDKFRLVHESKTSDKEIRRGF